MYPITEREFTMNNYSSINKSSNGRSAYFTFNSVGEKHDKKILDEALTQAYLNNVAFMFHRDDYGVISVWFSGIESNIDKIESFYKEKEK